ncbi:MAG: hypothetical protein AAGA48_22965 [Myxococcota bacterium]
MSHSFIVSEPFVEVDGTWWFQVWGRRCVRHGPFAARDAAWLASHHVFQRWADRARHLGGWAWRRTHREWVVSLPSGVPCGGLAFSPKPISDHRK